MRDHRRPGLTRGILFVLLGLIATAASLAATSSAQLTTTEKQNLEREARLVVDLLQNHHFSGRSFREMEGKAMISRFLEELDPQAEFLEAEEVDFLHRRFDRTFKSVYLFRGDLQPAFEIFDQFVSRARERLGWVQQRLDQGFDFIQPEAFAKRENPVPFKTRAEADHHWERLLKEHLLVERLRGRPPADAVAEVKRRFARMERTITAFDSLTVRERFFDAIIRSFDPHSGYFSADSSREFAVEMEKAVVGLGLDLRKEEGRCLVSAVQTGGSADLNSTLSPGDTIEAVADADGPWVETRGLRLREIVDRLRGKAGTMVRVAYRREKAGERREVMLERTRVQLGRSRAHGALSVVPGAAGTPRRIGWISLPSFYTAGENGSVTSVARDVRELLGQMTREPLDGLVLDLRNNPGGAVPEAVALSEIFLPGGVMMLSRGAEAKVTEHALKPGEPAFAGPLLVLTSHQSASASEVFAGAMKFHHRAVVAGAPTTYGKGTVQTYMELGKFPGGDTREWGTLRLTRERFYLPDGSSVQRTGIPADIVFPDFGPPEQDKGEAHLPGAMPAESVSAAAGLNPAALTGAVVTPPLLARLGELAADNIAHLPEWTLVKKGQERWRHDQATVSHSLVLEERRKEWSDSVSAFHDYTTEAESLIKQSAYPTTPCEIEVVREMMAALDARLRSADNTGQSRLHRLHQGSLVIEMEGGRLRKLRLEAFRFQNYFLDAESLADRLANATGHPVPAESVRQFLHRADLLEYPTEQSLGQAMAGLPGLEPGNGNQPLELLLSEIVVFDGSLRRERPAMDVPLREGLRLTAAWADRLHPDSHP